MRTRHSLPFGHKGCPVTRRQVDEQGWIDTGQAHSIGGARTEPLIISFGAAYALGRHVGMLDKVEAGKILEESIQLKERVKQLEGELREADAIIDGVDALTKRNDMVVRKPRGRPKRKADEDQE